MRTAIDTIDKNQNLALGYISPPMGLRQDWGIYIQANFTNSSLVGTWKLQTSCDYNPGTPQSGGAFNAGNWNDYPNSSLATTSEISDAWNVTDAFFPWIRLVFTYTSGAGVLSKLLAGTKGV